MIEVLNVLKANGELVKTRKNPFTVDSSEELEKERKKLEAHYDTKVYFVRRSLKEPLEEQITQK